MDKKYWLSIFKNAKRIEKFSSIVKMCEGKNVLDVGCIGQDHSLDGDNWLHGRIKKVSASLVGADINVARFDEIRSNGFEIYTPEDLDKSKKYDLIVMGDVIEHVNDPGVFLSFYAQFLKEDGQMVICTPNSFGARYFLQTMVYGIPGTNEEHTLSFDPYVMLELFSRIGLEPKEFFWLQEYRGGANLLQKLIFLKATVFVFLRRYLNSNFMFIVQKG